jgi:hypothetical protein
LELQQPGEIEKRLGKLPKDLKLAYDEIYNGMTEHERKIADRAFQWVMCAAKPLYTEELLPALCQDGTGDTLLPLDGLDEELALEYCHNLLVIDPIRKVWVPSHLSVIEYIEDHLWSQRQANSLVSSVCLLALQNTVLCNREKKWVMPEGVRYPLGRRRYLYSEKNFDPSDPLDHWEFIFLSFYARHHWAIHAKRSADKGSNHRISTLVDEFLGLPADSSPAYRCWMRMVTEEDTGGLPLTSIFRNWDLEFEGFEGFGECMAGFVYCAFDLAAILPGWHDFDWVEQDQRTDGGQTFLELAAQAGAVHTCRELVKHGAEVNAQTKSQAGSPLAAAILAGQENVVEFLLKGGGADVNMQLKNWRGSALAAASYLGREDLVRLLVKQGETKVNMQLQHGFFGSALAAASYRGGREVVEFLIKEGGAEVNMQLQYGDYGSALAAASCGEYQDVIIFLIKEGGAEVNMQLQHGKFGSALAAASYRGGPGVVKFLIKEGGAEMNMQLQYGKFGSALAAASYRGQKVVKFFIKEGGAEVNMQLQYGDYGSALAAASYGGKRKVVKILVEKGEAEVNLQLQHGRYANALEAAEKMKRFKTVELLLKLGAERKVVEDEDNDELNSDGEWVSYDESSADDEWGSGGESES